MKPKILALNTFYLPGYNGGGSIRALVNLVHHLQDTFTFKVVTSAFDLHETTPYSPEQQACVVGAEGYEIAYLPRGLAQPVHLWRQMREPWDALYLNSSFSPWFSILPLVFRRLMRKTAIPAIVAPRGELMAGALNSHPGKLRKKKGFLALARWTGHFAGVVFHATSIEEAEGIRALRLGEAAVVLAPDLPPTLGTDVDLGSPKIPGGLRIVFISRIDPKKNLQFIIETLAKLSSPIEFDIVGPVADEAYWSQCQEIIRQLPNHLQVRYLGSVPHHKILEVFRDHDCFFFPTHAENNGYVILESLLAGCPVLLSDRTPWRGLQERGVGFDLPLEQPEAFLTALEALIALSPDDHAGMRRAAQAYGRACLKASKDVTTTRALFEGVMC